MKSRDGKSQRREEKRRKEKRREEERRSKRESLRRKKIQVHEKVGKSRSTVFFPMICGSGGSKSRLAKASGAEQFGQMKDCTPLWCEAHLQVEMSKRSARRCGAKHIAKSTCTKHLMFGPLLERYIFRGRRSTRDMFIRDVGRSGRRFPDRGCILEHQMFRFAKVILRDRCSTSYDLASLFRGRHSTLDRCNGKIAKRVGTKPSALHSTFRF